MHENCWAPDVIWNEAMGKWCMYLSVNGANNNSVIVLLISDDLDGAWSYMGEVVYSGFNNDNYTSTDYTKVFPEATVVAEKYNVRRGGQMSYSLNAIDAAVTYDENGDLWMSYGSWFGGIYMLKLDEATGLRDYTYTYENDLRDGNGAAYTGAVTGDGGFAVISDEYLGLHIAGGYQTPMGGEGSYSLKIGGWWYLFLSYGGLDPDKGYNMRVFRSATLTGFDANGDFVGYKDAAGNSPIMLNAITTMNGTELNGTNGYDSQVGVRIMSGYTWSWWDYSYIAQGHNSAFVDGEKAYLVYHNKYTDGTIFHVLKVHELLVNADGWLVTSPFESTVQTTDVSSADELATGLSDTDIAGTYGTVYMTRNNGTYSDVCRESKITLNSDGTISGDNSGDNTGEWTYDKQTGGFTIRTNVDNRVHTGYLIYQNLEGTNIRTLVFTAINTSGKSISQYTYWGYKYPTAKQQAEYLINSYAIPDRATTDAVIPSGALSNGLWDDVKVTFSLEPSTGTLTATYEGGSIAIRIGLATEGTIEVDEVTAGKTFTPVNTDNGVSISFDYSNYTSDLTPVISGEGFSLALGVMQNFEGDESHLYEWQAVSQGAYTQFATNIYDAFLVPNGTARATISFNEDGSISYYRDGVWIFTQTYDTLFKRDVNGTQQDVAGQTVAAFNQKILAAFAAGTVKCDYNISNVVIGEQVSANNVYDETNFLTPTDTTISVIGEIKGAASGEVLPAIADATTDGVAISFWLNTAITSDWESQTISAANTTLNVTLPNLDAWNYSALSLHNKYPVHYENGGDYNSFKAICYVTVSVGNDGITYYKDGKKVAYYLPTEYMNYNNAGASTTVTVEMFIDAILQAIQTDGFVFGNQIKGEDLIVTNALTDEQAESIYQDYLNLSPYDSEKFIDVEGVEEIGEIKGAASGEVLPAIADATTDGVAISFWLNTAITSDWNSQTISAANTTLNVTLPNLDAWNYSALSLHNKYPVHYENGGDYNSFKAICYVTVSVGNDGITYYKDGKKVAYYLPTEYMNYNNAGASTTVTVDMFIDAILQAIQTGGFVFGNQIKGEDLIVTNALTDEQAEDVFDAYNAYLCIRDGHQYAESGSTGSVCTGFERTYTCSRCGDSYTATDFTGVVGHKYTVSATEATCTDPAKLTYTCSVCDDPFTAEGTPALGHDYGEPEWAWEGYTSATATFKCTRCDHTETETAAITNEVTTPATCEGAGVRTYTATVTFGEQKYTDTKTETIDALGHDYGEPEWAWEGYTSATATFTCTRSGCTHTEEATATIKSSVTTEATCEGAGVRTYTATVTFGKEQYTDDKTETIAALGHSWGTPVYAGTTLSVSCTRADCTAVRSATVAFAAGDGTGEITALTATFDGTVFTVTLPNDGMTANEEGYLLTGWTVGEESYATNVQVEIAPGANGTFTAVYTMHEHLYTAVAEVPATCEKEGVKAHFTCTCGRLFVSDGEGYTEVQPANLAISALGHDYTDVQPTWTWNGYTSATATFKCTRCDHTETETAVITNEVTTPATCEGAGVKTYTATVTFGGKPYTDDKTETIDALGHDYGEPEWAWEGYTSATATFTCTRSGCTHTEEVTAAITNEVTTPATCEGTGVRTYTATATFGGEQYTDTKTETIDALGHDYENVQPTWAWNGYASATATFKCTRCTHTKEVTATIESSVTTEATCEGTGVKTYTATVTFDEQKYTDTKTETIDALGHDYENVQPTWMWDGYASAKATFKCTRCDHTKEVTATIESSVTTEATCEGTGVKTYTATVTFDEQKYTATKTEEIPTAAHTPEAVPGKEATCTEAGLTEGSKCSVCGEVLKEQEEIPAKGHSWGEWTQTKPATCTEKGVKTRTCSACDATETADIDALGHDYENVQPTWAWEGYTSATATFTCTRCTHTEEATATIESSVTTEASCEGTGVKAYTATATFGKQYTDTKTEPVAALGHSWDEGSVTKPATCTEKGVKTFACTRDGCDKTRTEEIPAAGHTYSEEWLHDADGHWHKCESCDAVTQTEAHVWGDWTTTKEATATENGSRSRECSVCGEEQSEVIPATGTQPAPDDDPADDPDDDPDGSVSDEGLSDGAIAGIVIGCTVGALAIAYVVLAILFKKGIVKGAFFSRIFPFIK